MSKKRPTASLPTKRLTPELRTLLLKEELLAEQLPVTAELIQAIRDAGVPVDVTFDQLSKLTNNKDRIKRLLEALKWNWHEEYFDKLCDVFGAAVSPWLADELQTELQGENGTQQISEVLDLENGRIVFKEFGHEKRLSEIEKKRLLKLLNRKTQCTRDVWEKQLNRVNAKLDEAKRKGNTIDEEALRLATEIQQFIAEHAGDNFKSRAVTNGAQRTSDMFRPTPALQQLEAQINCLLQLTGQSLMETDNINDEKRRVVERIEPNSKQARTAALTAGSLDVKLSQHLDDKKQSIIDCKLAIEEQQKLAEKLSEEIERAEKERQDILAEKQRIIGELTERVSAKDLENEDTEQCVEKLRAELDLLQLQLDNYTTRATHLERGRRLQTIISTVTDAPTADKDKKTTSTTLPKIVETESRSAYAKRLR